MAHNRHIAAYASLAAAVSMAATPATAAELPTEPSNVTYVAPGVFAADSENVERYRRYRHRYHRHRRGVDAGDVIAGVLILGGIAAIASAASNNDRDRRYRDREYRNRDRDYDYRERRENSRYDGARGIDRAVEMCVSRIERDVRVDRVDSVDRNGEGWRVAGRLYNGESFSCRIGSDGRVDDVDYGSIAASEPRQLSDDRYRTAWAEVDRAKATESSDTEARPAYPGGPLPGEEVVDDRYTTAEPARSGG
jgi:hypothetical protein